MFSRVLLSNKLRLASFGVAGTLATSIIFPSAYVLADTISADTAASDAGNTTSVPVTVPSVAPLLTTTSASDATATNGIAITDHSTSVSSSDVATTLAHDGSVLAASDQTQTTSDSSSAIKAVTAGASVEVPKNPNEGVTLGVTDGPKLDIQLPNTGQSQDAQQVAPGTVAYPSDNGSASAVQATEDGGVRMLTVIDNPNAPTTYDYKVTVPDGGHIELTSDGGASIVDQSGTILVSVATPWAHDATGKPVQTYFTTDGMTLTQHVEHNVPGVVYPVTADPWWMSRFWSYVGCVVGIGAPIGVAIVIASLPATWPAVYLWASKQAMNGDRAIISYIYRVHDACRRFMNS